MKILPIFNPESPPAELFGKNHVALLPGKRFGMDSKIDKTCSFDVKALKDLAYSAKYQGYQTVMIAEEHKGSWLQDEATMSEVMAVHDNYSLACSILREAGFSKVIDYGQNYNSKGINKLRTFLSLFDAYVPGAKLHAPAEDEKSMRRTMNRIEAAQDLELPIWPMTYHRRDPNQYQDADWAYSIIDKNTSLSFLKLFKDKGISTCLLGCQYDYGRAATNTINFPKISDPKDLVKYLTREVKQYIKLGKDV